MKTAVRAENLVLDGPVPVELLHACTVTVTDPEEVFDPTTGQTDTRFIERQVRAYLPLVDGRVVFPRNAFSDDALRAAGYSVSDVRSRARKRLDWRDAADRIALRPRQEVAAAATDGGEDGCLVLGTGVGKTILALYLAAKSGLPALAVVDTGNLREQWIERATDKHLFDLDPSEVGRCTGPVNTWEWDGRSLCITTFQSLGPALERGDVPLEFLEYFGWLFVDEMHVAGSPTRLPLLSLFRCRRIGLSATPERRGWEKVMYMHLGQPTVEDREPEILPDVYVRGVKTAKSLSLPETSDAYRRMLDAVLGTARKPGDDAYRRALAELLRELEARGRRVLFLSPRKGLLRRLQDDVESAVVIDGSVDSRDRSHLLLSSDVVGVTTQIGEKALDRADLDTLVMSVPVGSSAVGRMRQAVGRILRLFPGKGTPEVYILYPECSYARNLGERNVEMCESLGFTVRERPSEVEKERESVREHARRRAVRAEVPLLRNRKRETT